MMGFLSLEGRPRPVRLAVYLLLVVLCAGLAVFLVKAAVHHVTVTPSTLIAIGVGLAVNVGLVLGIAHARRWALTLYILLFAWTVVSLPITLSAHHGPGLLGIAWDAVSLALNTTALVLLFLPESRRWFAASTAAHRSRPMAS